MDVDDQGQSVPWALLKLLTAIPTCCPSGDKFSDWLHAQCQTLLYATSYVLNAKSPRQQLEECCAQLIETLPTETEWVVMRTDIANALEALSHSVSL